MSAVTDPIADMLTRIRNGIRARHPRVDMPASKLKVEVVRVLKEEGYISNFKVSEEGKKKILKVFLRYGAEGENVITALERISKPGRRVYSKIKDLARFYNGLGIAILSTPRGVMSDAEARAQNVGGEVLCQVF